jgi:uncharacterized protein with PIN domain
MTVERPRFVADAMLGSVARKLRIFGFDTLYHDAGEDDSVLEALAWEEGRVMLTSDTILFEHARKRGIRAVRVVGDTDRARLKSIIDQVGQSMKRQLREALRSSSAATATSGPMAGSSVPSSSFSTLHSRPSSRRLRTTSSRCAVCNGELSVMSRQEAISAGAVIPKGAISRHRLFFKCTSCSKFYWRGKHWERLRRLSYSLA